MDLKTSPAIIDAVKERVDHGIFGYSFPTEGAKTAVMDYYKASRQRFAQISILESSYLLCRSVVESVAGVDVSLPHRS